MLFIPVLVILPTLSIKKSIIVVIFHILLWSVYFVTEVVILFVILVLLEQQLSGLFLKTDLF
jgi:hypothetical protein